jgi:hypothetical protein
VNLGGDPVTVAADLGDGGEAVAVDGVDGFEDHDTPLGKV